MSVVRRHAEFRTDFPEDHIWNEDEGDVVQTGGRAVAEAIAEILIGMGCTIHILEDNVGHCWECCFRYRSLDLWVRVVGCDPCLLMVEEPHRAIRDYALHVHLLLELNEHLRLDGRFHDLAWYDPEDRRNSQETFDTPVTDAIPVVDVSLDTGMKSKSSLLDKFLAPLKARPENR